MLEENNQFSLWPHWRKGSPPEDEKEPVKSEKTEKDKKEENIDRTIKDIYRKIDEAKVHLEKKEANQEVKNEPKPESSEEDDSSSSQIYDYKKRQYKD